MPDDFRRSGHTVNEVSCVFGTADNETVMFYTSYLVGQDEPMAGAQVENGDGVIIRAGQSAIVFGPPTMSSTVALATEDGTAAGEFSVAASMAEAETSVEQVDEWDGNLHTWGTVTTTQFDYTVTSATLTGTTLEIGELPCTGSTIVFDLQNNNPKFHITKTVEYESDPCQLKGNAPSEVWLRGAVDRPEYTVIVHRKRGIVRGMGELTMKGRFGWGKTELSSPETEELAGTVKIAAQFKQLGKPSRQRIVEGNRTYTITKVPFQASVLAKTSARERGAAVCAVEKVTTVTKTKRR